MDAGKRLASLEQQLAERDAQNRALVAKLAEADLQIAQLRHQVLALTHQLAELTRKLGQNSDNSNAPPSSDGPGARKKPNDGNNPAKGAKKKRKRGGQPGHKGHQRGLEPPEKVDTIINLFPSHCTGCAAKLPETVDPDAKRSQTVELPPLRPVITEYRRHDVVCSCGHVTCADASGVPRWVFGPRLTSTVAMLSGVYHIGRRRVCRLLAELLGVSMSVGAVSNIERRISRALAVPQTEVATAVDAAAVKHADATSWLEAGKLRSLWVLAIEQATLFRIVKDGRAETIYPLFGTCSGTLVSDRGTVFSFWDPKRRQICWSHLVRKFVSFAELPGLAGRLGRRLLDLTALLFQYCRDRRTHTLTHERFRAWMQPVCQGVELALNQLANAHIKQVSGSCRDILAHVPALWTFVRRADVEPTNNHAERELRRFVLWRKNSFGAQSQRGHEFAERIMTVAHTARKQNKDIFAFIVAAYEATLAGTAMPTLLTAVNTS